ncbi:MAG: hypothetical protein WCO00_10565 [Rhodospirillaceae bacterium]
MRPLIALLCAVVAAACWPASAEELIDVTEPSCAETAAQLKQDPESWDSIHFVVQWTYGYIVGTNNLSTGTDYKSIGKMMKDLSAGKCSDPKASLYALIKKIAARKVADKDAYDITALACEDFFNGNTDEYGRLNREGLIADIAWLSGYAAGQAKAEAKADFTLLGASGQLTINKCKTSAKLNVATVLEMMIPSAVAALEKAAAAKKAPAPTVSAPVPVPAPAPAPQSPQPDGSDSGGR